MVALGKAGREGLEGEMAKGRDENLEWWRQSLSGLQWPLRGCVHASELIEANNLNTCSLLCIHQSSIKRKKLSWTGRALCENWEGLRWGLVLTLEGIYSPQTFLQNVLCVLHTPCLPWKKAPIFLSNLIMCRPLSCSLSSRHSNLEPSHLFQPWRLCPSCSCWLDCSSTGSLHGWSLMLRKSL